VGSLGETEEFPAEPVLGTGTVSQTTSRAVSVHRVSRLLLSTAVAVLTVGALAACGSDEDPTAELVIEDVWAMPTEAGGDVEVNMLIRSGTDDELVGVSVEPEVAADATFVGAEGDPVESFELADDGLLILASDGNRIVLGDVAQTLVAGDRFEVVIELDRAGEQFIAVAVGDGPPFD
jgi:copper(I)-binding protein